MSDKDELDLDAPEAMASTVQGWGYGGLAGQIPGTIRALIAEVRRLRGVEAELRRTSDTQ